jgi:hypothetical protein
MSNTTSKEVLAQDIMDTWYGEFKEENEDFHDLDFFIRKVEDTRGEILQTVYNSSYSALRGENVASTELVRFSGIWLDMAIIEFREDKETGYYVATLGDKKPFSFLNDNSNTALQDLVPVHRDSCRLSRTTIGQLYLQKHLPKTDIQFWWPEQDMNGSFCLFATTNCCKKAKLFYISEDADEISKGAANMISERILDMLRKASGKAIDTTNDSNPNATVQTEVNKEEMK